MTSPAPRIDATHDPALRSWVDSANDPATDFPIQNLPLAGFRMAHHLPDRAEDRLGAAIGDRVLDLREAHDRGLLEGVWQPEEESDAAMALALGDAAALWRVSAQTRRALRARLVELLRADGPLGAGEREGLTHALSSVQLGLPCEVRNYTDFYASVHHATTVGAMFRPDNPLLPNYKWVPIGYHGRASSIVPSGAAVSRPQGQTKADDASAPVFGPCKLLDYELEVGCFIAGGNELGRPVSIAAARDMIAGLCLVNDWSARDVQKWEYQPLGPFLAKNFATSVSPFVVSPDALEPFRCPAYSRPQGDPAPLDYLVDPMDQALGGFDLTLEVLIASEQMRTRGMAPVSISRGRTFRDMYWTFAQMIAHHTSNGCNLRSGDLIASGTVSGNSPGARGCLLESTWDGVGPDGKPRPRKPIDLPTGEKRTFLADGDEVILRGWCEREGFRRVGLGECRGIIRPVG